jgi:hypothetical protein
MERNLLLAVCSLGVVAWAAAMLLAGRAGPRGLRVARPSLAVGGALPILVFLATLPSRPPFAAGHRLGWGFLIGGLAALIAFATLSRGASPGIENGPERRSALLAGACFLAVAAAVAPAIWFRSAELDALLGTAIGWLSVTLTLLAGLGMAGEERSALTLLASAAAGFCVAACTAVGLGEYRGVVGDALTPNPLTWAGIAACWAFTVPIAILIASVPARLVSAAVSRLPFAGRPVGVVGRLFGTEESQAVVIGLLRALAACLVGLATATLLEHRAGDQFPAVRLAAIGMAAALVSWWLCTARSDTDAARQQNGAISVIVMLLGAMLAYQWMAGFGLAVYHLAIWIALAVPLASLSCVRNVEQPAAPDRPDARAAARLVGLMLFMVAWALYRLFGTRFSHDLRGVGLADHYALFGVMLGVVMPAALAGYVRRRAQEGASAGQETLDLARLAFAGAILLLTPGMMLLLWGPKAALALVMGLALGIPIAAARREPDVDPCEWAWAALLPGLLALACLLALCQWTDLVLACADLTRAEKVQIVLKSTGTLAALMLIADYGGRALVLLRARQPRTGTAK